MQKEEQPVSVKRGWRFYRTFGTLALLNLIYAINTTILLVALPASFSHISGRKSVLLAALLLFTVSTVIILVTNNVALLLIFWLNIPFYIIAIIGIPICLRLYIKEGSFLFMATTTSCLILRTLVPLILGVFGLIGFTIYSVNISTKPLIRHTLFNSPTAIVAYIGTLVAKNYLPITSSVTIFPFTFTIVPAAIIVFLSLIARTGLGMLFSVAIYSFFRAFKQTLSIAISSVIFQNVFKKKILATTYLAFINSWAEGVIKEGVIMAYIKSLRITKEISLERELETE
ncbi:MFS multidrug transporter-like protein [Halenospora varia]|nr:MFS multidrug transporter-like protein [Halenospora varia]